LEHDPPPGIVCYPIDDGDITHLESFIKGPPDSPFEHGTFRLDIKITENYPFDPPQMRFKTKIYHPNIDEGGRICADILKKGAHGGWKPSLNLSTTLLSLQSLLSGPNPDDPLDAEIAQEYMLDYERFARKAKEFTMRYATGSSIEIDSTVIGSVIHRDRSLSSVGC
ncbi:ubiquitin-conjugating enzyme/RWD-like protein, partial [Dichotomocladium elegans]